LGSSTVTVSAVSGNTVTLSRSIGTEGSYEGCIFNSQAYGTGSHTEGGENNAFGNYSHAEGYHTNARGEFSHTEG